MAKRFLTPTEYKTKAVEDFTQRHSLDCLVYFEEFRDIVRAFNRQKEIKEWLRVRKLALIESANPARLDLSVDWFERPLDSSLRSE